MRSLPTAAQHRHDVAQTLTTFFTTLFKRSDQFYSFSVAISVSPYVCFILDLILISMFLR